MNKLLLIKLKYPESIYMKYIPIRSKKYRCNEKSIIANKPILIPIRYQKNKSN